jgi:heme/copper-type cytochrome/quinol oxidase subunit 2
MSGANVFFLLCGAFLTGCVAWGLATGKMPSKYLHDDRDKHPVWFWAIGAVYAVLALVFFYVTWLEWS